MELAWKSQELRATDATEGGRDDMQRIRHPSRDRRRNLGAISLVGALILMVLGQCVFFPLLLSFFVAGPLPSMEDDNHPVFPSQIRKKKSSDKRADATLNGVPLTLHRSTMIPESHVHCVGENYQPESAWKQRSCHFHNLCFNVTSKEFVLFQSERERYFATEFLANRPFLHTSSTIMRYGPNVSYTVSLGGLNMKWGNGKNGVGRLEWFPRVLSQAEISSGSLTYYSLPDDMVWVPFHSMNGANPGHLIWDDFLPIYTLLSMFQLLPEYLQDKEAFGDLHQIRSLPLLPMRYVLTNGERGLWASCDLRPEKTQECNHMIHKFVALLVGKDYPYSITSTQDFVFQRLKAASTSQLAATEDTDLVCARHGVAGVAALTDHGISKMHGWEEEDYLFVHNHGRGGTLYEFQKFMLWNMGLSINHPIGYERDEVHQPKRPHRIIFSQKSSDIYIRNMDFERTMAVVKKHFPPEYLQIEAYIFKNYSAADQISIVRDASIFVTLCGGGAVTAMFLPAGASLFLFYSEDGGAKNNRLTHKPALLDWDLFNAMSHLRVHWLPRNTMKSKLDESYFVSLIQHELDLMDSKVFEYR